MSIARESFEFTDIKNIQHLPQWRSIDVCGIVAEVGPCENKNLKSGVQKKQRNVVIIDDSGCGINLGLWGDVCEKVNEKNIHTVLAVKGVQVSDFGGKSLNVSDEKS